MQDFNIHGCFVQLRCDTLQPSQECFAKITTVWRGNCARLDLCFGVCIYSSVYIYICFLFSVVACVQHLSLLQEDIERESASEEVEHGPRLGMGMNGSCQSA